MSLLAAKAIRNDMTDGCIDVSVVLMLLEWVVSSIYPSKLEYSNSIMACFSYFVISNLFKACTKVQKYLKEITSKNSIEKLKLYFAIY